jgi:pimeloyl-ACP methyl ester carboxylesterase
MTTFVLVPGAWLGGWVWKKIMPDLEKEGNAVYPVTLTGMGERVHLLSSEVGIETAVNDVINVIKYNQLENVVLVGHSFAAKVVASVADRIPEKIRLIIYLDTFRPENIRTPQQSFQPDEFGKLEPGQTTIPFTDDVLKMIGSDVEGEDRVWMHSLATPWPLKYATDPIVLTEKFDSVRSAHIFCTKSGSDVNEIIAGKWGKVEGKYKIIEAAHFPMITRPEETVSALVELSKDD